MRPPGASGQRFASTSPPSAGSEQHCRLAIYNDLSNSPNTLVGGGELTIPTGGGAAEFTLALPGTAAAPNGVYWVGFHLKLGSGPQLWYATTGGTMAYGTPSYAAGLPSPYNETNTNSVNDVRVAADCATPSVAPVADFTGTPTSGTTSLSVTFTDASTNSPTSWAWDFGDGATSTSQNPTHSYTSSGVYTVTLIATNGAGSNTKTRAAYITASEAIVYAAGGGIEIW